MSSIIFSTFTSCLAAADAIHAGQNMYTRFDGITPLREAIAFKEKRDYDVTLDPETEIVVTNGASGVCTLSLLRIVAVWIVSVLYFMLIFVLHALLLLLVVVVVMYGIVTGILWCHSSLSRSW